MLRSILPTIFSKIAKGTHFQQVIWTSVSHNQDAKAHPYRTISGSINLETNRNTQRNNYDYANITNNKLTSNFITATNGQSLLFFFQGGLLHNQDNRLRVVNITLPDASLNMATVQPFKRKNVSGDAMWYENISVTYTCRAQELCENNRHHPLFTRSTLDKIETGFSHQAMVNSSARVLKYFNLSPQITYDEVYFLKTVEKTFDPTLVKDTIELGKDAEGNPITEIRVLKYGTVSQDFKTGLEVYRKLNASISIFTNILVFIKNTGFFRASAT